MVPRFVSEEEFNKNFDKEMASACEVYERRKEIGITDYTLATYDYDFISDKKENLDALGNFLTNNYGYKVNEVQRENEYWILTGDTTEFPVDESNLMYWALDLYCKGYEFESKLVGYGSFDDPQNQKFPDMDMALNDHYFELATDAYNKRNLGMAFIHFSTAIRIDPSNPDAWYSRAIVREELHTWKSARGDYDKAILLAPDFVDALVNRAANKDEAGEYKEAIVDYNKVIELDPGNEMAFFNCGNTKFNIKDFKGACEDWNSANQLGADYAQNRIDKHCR